MNYLNILFGPAKNRALLPGLAFGIIGIILAVGGFFIPPIFPIIRILAFIVMVLGFALTIVIGFLTAKDINSKDLKQNVIAGAMGGLFFGIIYGLLRIF